MAYVPNAHPEGGRHATATDVNFSIGSVKPFRGEALKSSPLSRPWRAEAHGGVDQLDAELAASRSMLLCRTVAPLFPSLMAARAAAPPLDCARWSRRGVIQLISKPV